jgi:hypothetical protein
MMNSYDVRDRPMRAEDYKEHVRRRFQSVLKLTYTKDGYKMMGQYDNLSHYIFSDEEIELLCDCYYSGKHSLIGVTGEDRLTIEGICERYRISHLLVEGWIEKYKAKMTLVTEMMAFINGT